MTGEWVSNVDPNTGRGDCVTATGTKLSFNAGIIKISTSLPQTTAEEVSAAPDNDPAIVSSELEGKENDDLSNYTTAEEVSAAPDNDPAIVSSELEGKETDDSSNYNCRGKPCVEQQGSNGEVYCRSKYQFCGVGEEYCNSESQWTSECGTPEPTDQPSMGPTTGEPTGAPTTSQPTFTHDPDVHCVGEPCNEQEDGDRTWCRSEMGYCGAGRLYCNLYSSWVPECDQSDQADTVTGGGDSVPSVSPSAAQLLADTPSLEKMSAPSKENALFSSFALPTLSQIVNPKQFNIGSATRDNSDSSTQERVDDQQTPSAQTSNSLSGITKPLTTEEINEETILVNSNSIDAKEVAEETSWYVRFEGVRSIDRNIGFQRTVKPLESFVLFSIIINHLAYL